MHKKLGRPRNLVQQNFGESILMVAVHTILWIWFQRRCQVFVSVLLFSLKRRENPELFNGSWVIHWIMQHNRGQENKKLWIYTSSLTLNPRLAVHSLSSRHGVTRVHCVGMIFLGSSVPWKDEPGQNRDVLLAATGTAATSTGQRTGQNERAYAKNTWLATNPSTCYIVNIIFIEQKSVYIEI